MAGKASEAVQRRNERIARMYHDKHVDMTAKELARMFELSEYSVRQIAREWKDRAMEGRKAQV